MPIDAERMVLWADKVILAVNKPPGLPTLPDGYHPEATHLRSLLEPCWGRLWIVHRLDRDTSGALVLARNAAAHRLLNEQFQAHRVRKTYHALVVGNPTWDEQTIELPLRVDADRRHRTHVDPNTGKYALTQVRVLERFGFFCLIEATPGTGRTHQIRAHLAAVGFPVACDPLYGQAGRITAADLIPDGSNQVLLARTGLHASSLDIQHPQDLCWRRIDAPYPPDFDAVLCALQALRQGGFNRTQSR